MALTPEAAGALDTFALSPGPPLTISPRPQTIWQSLFAPFT